MPRPAQAPFAAIPSVDRLLNEARAQALVAAHGHELVLEAVREATAALRAALRAGDGPPEDPTSTLLAQAEEHIARLLAPSLRPVLNLTGTVLHTNLGRAPLPPEAVRAMVEAAAGACNLEMDLASGRRGERDAHVEGWLCRLTGAEAATVVNNNAAAILLALNSLAVRKEVPVSRGELIEIGGSFRLPDIMRRAGCKLVEVGTTNRTHLGDYAAAIGARTAMLMKVHTSNYQVQGFTAAVEPPALAGLAREHGLALMNDLGSGSLVDLSGYGLPKEPTPRQAIEQGADLVTFSGDKLLGGPQCGMVVGRADLVARLKRNPMKRAMRLDKVTLAALEAVLALYASPELLARRLPTLRLLARPAADIEALARRLAPTLGARLEGVATVEVVPCESQIGSGALPLEVLPSAGLALRPAGRRGTGGGAAVARLAQAFRALPLPVIGRIADGALVFDLRCLEAPEALIDELHRLQP